MTKALRKAIMKKSEFENKYVKIKANEKLKSYKSSKLNKNETKNYYKRLNLKNFENKK